MCSHSSVWGWGTALITGPSDSCLPPGIWCVSGHAASPSGLPVTKHSPRTDGALRQLMEDGNITGLRPHEEYPCHRRTSVLTLQEEKALQSIDSVEVLMSWHILIYFFPCCFTHFFSIGDKLPTSPLLTSFPLLLSVLAVSGVYLKTDQHRLICRPEGPRSICKSCQLNLSLSPHCPNNIGWGRERSCLCPQAVLYQ